MLDEMGLQRRLHRLVPEDRAALWLPLDDGLISGPEDHLRDLRRLLTYDVLEDVTAVLGFRGVLCAHRAALGNTPLVMNLSAGTTLTEHTRKVAVGSVADALRADASAVACHVNFTSPFEAEQIAMLSQRVGEAQTYGMPVVAFAYPRGRRSDGSDENYLDLREHRPEEFTQLVRHCVRVAAELGASVVKTIFTGSAESFATVVQSAMGVPVLIAGERLADEKDVLTRSQMAVEAGAAGVAYGRQIFARDEPRPFLGKLREGLDKCWSAARDRRESYSPHERIIQAPTAAPAIVTADALWEPQHQPR